MISGQWMLFAGEFLLNSSPRKFGASVRDSTSMRWPDATTFRTWKAGAMPVKPEFRSWAVQYGELMPSFCCTSTPKLPQDTEVILRLSNDFPCGNPTTPKLDSVRRFLLQKTG